MIPSTDYQMGDPGQIKFSPDPKALDAYSGRKAYAPVLSFDSAASLPVSVGSYS
jgi:hypothetical protein